eukprot:TRINITY_DN8994_c0_g1_i1.p1 TRINITY_DN8994_c0_g1~~TRINITY_DN8994_c0_g1_i1.p1  ORF type:complete len:275 (+),score=98.49 TRINITY_DN8994_c0_g1_i1:46-870(+)
MSSQPLEDKNDDSNGKITFKKRKKSGNVRSKKISTENSSDANEKSQLEGENDDETQENEIPSHLYLELKKDLLKKKPKGIQISASMPFSHVSSSSPSLEPQTETLPSITTALYTSFEKENKSNVEDIYMAQYIEKMMREKRAKENSSSEKSQNSNKKEERSDSNRGEEDKSNFLYEIPEHLKARKRTAEEMAVPTMAGIEEVDLNDQYRINNIEETEKAKERLEEEKRKKAGSDSSFSKTHNRFAYVEEKQRAGSRLIFLHQHNSRSTGHAVTP